MIYVDLLLLGRGKTLTSVVFTTVGKPQARWFEERVSRVLAEKLDWRPRRSGNSRGHAVGCDA